MNTWDELAMERANLFSPPPSDCELGLTYPLEALRDGKRDAFVLGAEWQRAQLLTDEAIDQVAMALHEVDVADASADYRERARVALTAAIGDQS